jgi:hypothetical protein
MLISITLQVGRRGQLRQRDASQEGKKSRQKTQMNEG